MPTELTEVEFIFENCQTAIVPAKYIIRIDIAEKISIEIDKAAANLDLNFLAYDEKLFERIRMWEDITSFELRYSDGSEKIIHPPWEGDPNDVTNLFQKSHLENDNLVIEIDPNLAT